jgi:hypothetical protein
MRRRALVRGQGARRDLGYLPKRCWAAWRVVLNMAPMTFQVVPSRRIAATMWHCRPRRHSGRGGRVHWIVGCAERRVGTDGASNPASPGRVLLDVALTLADGGDCLSDLAVLRDQPGLLARWPPLRQPVESSMRSTLIVSLPSGRPGRRLERRRGRPGCARSPNTGHCF